MKHGHCKGKPSKTYYVWADMIKRCTDAKHKDYALYGGRGITVCDSWLKFSNFLQDMGEKPEGYSLDRISNDLGYSKSNCRWTTQLVQQRNKRNNKLIVFRGETYCLVELAEKFNITYHTLLARLNNNWDVEKAVTTPVKAWGRPNQNSKASRKRRNIYYAVHQKPKAA